MSNMKRFTKYHSNYRLKKRHQNINGGVVYEKDFVTIGELQNFGSSKRVYYSNGNFIFTNNNSIDSQYRHKTLKIIGDYTYNDVKNNNDLKEYFTFNNKHDNICDFAYYGSCVELIKCTIEEIISDFPANITLSEEKLYFKPIDSNSSFEEIDGNLILNDYGIDLYHKDIVLKKYDNIMRFMSLSYMNYTINGVPITNYEVINSDIDKECPENNQWYILRKPIVIVKLNDIVLDGYLVNDKVKFICKEKKLDIRPKQEIIDDYFKGLKYFKKQLLNRESNPLYKNIFITPIEDENGMIKYINKEYIWKSNDYCPRIDSSNYISFLNSLLDMGEKMDEIWCDNLYKNMTHEAIKNYDWSYTKEYSNEDEYDNINGGECMHNVLNIISRTFDEIKYNIDNIKNTTNVSYDDISNMSKHNIDEKINLKGIDITNIEPMKNSNSIILDNKYLNKWFNTVNINDINFDKVNSHFKRNLLLSENYLLSSKGTINSIEMILGLFGIGGNDFNITEEYLTTKAKENKIDNNDNLEYIIKNILVNRNVKYNIYDEFPGIMIEKAVSNLGKEYILPFYNQYKKYDGNIYYQSNGGWGKYDDSKNNGIHYMETLSYMKVASRIGEMLSYNINSFNKGDVFYIINISDFMEYYEANNTTPLNVEDITNFFILKGDNANEFSSWENVTLNKESNRYNKEYADKVLYLDNIITTNFGNNPHVGYGKYDNGENYFEYIHKPLKYSIDNNLLMSEHDKNEAEKLTFDLTKNTGDKIINTLKYDDKGKFDAKITEDEYFNTYHLNSKVMTMTNNIDNELYKKYFRERILPYVLQFIPSTTILILKGF